MAELVQRPAHHAIAIGVEIFQPVGLVRVGDPTAFPTCKMLVFYTMDVRSIPTATFDSVMKALHGMMFRVGYAGLLLATAARVCEEAEDMIAAGAIGDVVRDTLRHAEELLDVADAELLGVQTDRYQVLAAASPLLRARLRVLRDRAG